MRELCLSAGPRNRWDREKINMGQRENQQKRQRGDQESAGSVRADVQRGLKTQIEEDEKEMEKEVDGTSNKKKRRRHKILHSHKKSQEVSMKIGMPVRKTYQCSRGILNRLRRGQCVWIATSKPPNR